MSLMQNTPSGVETRNEEAIRRTMEDIWSRGNLSLIPVLFTPDYKAHYTRGENVLGHDGFRKMVEDARRAFPDLKCVISKLVAEGDDIVCLYTLSGTNDGEFSGNPPTGKKVSVLSMFLTTMEDGKSAETLPLSDALALYQQLGIAPPGYDIERDSEGEIGR